MTVHYNFFYNNEKLLTKAFPFGTITTNRVVYIKGERYKVKEMEIHLTEQEDCFVDVFLTS